MRYNTIWYTTYRNILRKAIEQMKKKSLPKVLRMSFICLLVAALVFGIFAIPSGKVSGYNA